MPSMRDADPISSTEFHPGLSYQFESSDSIIFVLVLSYGWQHNIFLQGDEWNLQKNSQLWRQRCASSEE